MKGRETGYAPRASRETRISRPLFKPNLHSHAPGARPARSAAPLAAAAAPAGQPPAAATPRPLPTGPAAAAICMRPADWPRGRGWGFPLGRAGIPVRRPPDTDSCGGARRNVPGGRGHARPRPPSPPRHAPRRPTPGLARPRWTRSRSGSGSRSRSRSRCRCRVPRRCPCTVGPGRVCGQRGGRCSVWRGGGPACAAARCCWRCTWGKAQA